IMVLRRFGKVTGLLGYDKRTDNNNFTNEDDGDQFFTGFVAPIGQDWTLGFLYVYWLSNHEGSPYAGPGGAGYVVQGASLIAPYLEGNVGILDLGVGANYMFGGDVEGAADGTYFAD